MTFIPAEKATDTNERGTNTRFSSSATISLHIIFTQNLIDSIKSISHL